MTKSAIVNICAETEASAEVVAQTIKEYSICKFVPLYIHTPVPISGRDYLSCRINHEVRSATIRRYNHQRWKAYVRFLQ